MNFKILHLTKSPIHRLKPTHYVDRKARIFKNREGFEVPRQKKAFTDELDMDYDSANLVVDRKAFVMSGRVKKDLNWIVSAYKERQLVLYKDRLVYYDPETDQKKVTFNL